MVKDRVMLERVRAPAADGGGAGPAGGERVGLALADHRHAWVRLSGSVGLFVCADRACLWAAVCPGCLDSLEVAFRAQAGIVGLALYWCALHGGEGEP